MHLNKCNLFTTANPLSAVPQCDASLFRTASRCERAMESECAAINAAIVENASQQSHTRKCFYLWQLRLMGKKMLHRKE